jgi:hypothetical protein
MTNDYWSHPYKCRHVGCNRRFRNASTIQKHIKKYHPNYAKSVIPGTKPIYRMAF